MMACLAPPFATPGVYHLHQYTIFYHYIGYSIQRRPPVASPVADSFVCIAGQQEFLARDHLILREF